MQKVTVAAIGCVLLNAALDIWSHAAPLTFNVTFDASTASTPTGLLFSIQ